MHSDNLFLTLIFVVLIFFFRLLAFLLIQDKHRKIPFYTTYIYLYFALDFFNCYNDKEDKVDIRLPINPFTVVK